MTIADLILNTPDSLRTVADRSLVASRFDLRFLRFWYSKQQFWHADDADLRVSSAAAQVSSAAAQRFSQIFKEISRRDAFVSRGDASVLRPVIPVGLRPNNTASAAVQDRREIFQTVGRSRRDRRWGDNVQYSFNNYIDNLW